MRVLDQPGFLKPKRFFEATVELNQQSPDEVPAAKSIYSITVFLYHHELSSRAPKLRPGDPRATAFLPRLIAGKAVSTAFPSHFSAIWATEVCGLRTVAT